MTVTHASVLIRNTEKITSPAAIHARGVAAFKEANGAADPAVVTLTGQDAFEEYTAYHFELKA